VLCLLGHDPLVSVLEAGGKTYSSQGTANVLERWLMAGLRSLALQYRCSRVHPANRCCGLKESFLCSVSTDGSIDDDSVEVLSGTNSCSISKALRDAVPLQLHFMMLLCPSASCALFERLVE
jgi:hypothetical protein